MSNLQQLPDTTGVNGVDTGRVAALAGHIQADAEHGAFCFRAANRWISGAHTTSSIQGFFAGGREDRGRSVAHLVESDQPVFLGGDDAAPNPVEYLLHALGSCLTTTLVYHAAVQGIEIDNIESAIEGDLDARGFFGISDQVDKGYHAIRANLQVQSNAAAETLIELAMFSPVYEMLSRATPVDFRLTVDPA